MRFDRMAFSAVALSAIIGALTPTIAQELPMAEAETVGMSSARLGKIKEVFGREIEAGGLPGAVIMIVRDGKLIYSEALGFQDKASGKLMSKDSVFRILSMTKPLTSVAAMMLVEDGAISLPDPVSKFFPALSNMKVAVMDKDGKVTFEPAKKQMTVQDLLRHTAGLDVPEFTPVQQIKDAYLNGKIYDPSGGLGEYRKLTPEQQVAALANVPLGSEPGAYWRYSVATDLLGRVIEAVSGKRLGEFLDERLFRPLKMKDTAFFVPESNWNRIAQPLPTDPITKKPATPMLDIRTKPASDSGAAGSVSTAGDYLRFCQMMLDGGILQGARILSPTTIKLMASDHLGQRSSDTFSPGGITFGVEGYTFGLGFMVRQNVGLSGIPGSQGEYMWAGAGGTFFWIDPKERMAVVMMAQTPSAIRIKYRHLIKQLVAQAIEKSY